MRSLKEKLERTQAVNKKEYYSVFRFIKEADVEHIKAANLRSQMRSVLETALTENLDSIHTMHGKDKFEALKDIYLGFLTTLAFFAKNHQSIKTEIGKISLAVDLGSEVFMISARLGLSQDESIRYFTDKINRHTSDFPPKKIYIFDLVDVKAMTEFMLYNYFDKYSLYMKAFSKKKMAIYKFKGIGSFGRFPTTLPVEEGDYLGEGEEMIAEHQVLKNAFGIKDGLGAQDFGFGFTYNELEWLLGDGVATYGINFGTELGARARRDHMRDKILQGRLGIPEGLNYKKEELNAEQAQIVIERFKALSVKEREELIKKKMEKDRKDKIDKILGREIVKIRGEVDKDIKEVKKEYELEDEEVE